MILIASLFLMYGKARVVRLLPIVTELPTVNPLEKQGDGSMICNEPVKSNGHTIQVSPLKRVFLRNVPQLSDELLQVVNVFDPWARDRGDFYSLDWAPRGDSASDPAFDK